VRRSNRTNPRNRLGGIIHTYQAYDPKSFPSPTSAPPDMVSSAFEHLLRFGSTRRLTEEELARAVRIDPSQIRGLGPSIDALLAMLEERKGKILGTYETDTVQETAGRTFRLSSVHDVCCSHTGWPNVVGQPQVSRSRLAGLKRPPAFVPKGIDASITPRSSMTPTRFGFASPRFSSWGAARTLNTAPQASSAPAVQMHSILIKVPPSFFSLLLRMSSLRAPTEPPTGMSIMQRSPAQSVPPKA